MTKAWALAHGQPGLIPSTIYGSSSPSRVILEHSWVCFQNNKKLKNKAVYDEFLIHSEIFVSLKTRGRYLVAMF